MLFGATKLNNGGFGLSPSQLYQIRLRFWSVGVAKKNEVELVIILAKIVAILQARARVYFCKKKMVLIGLVIIQAYIKPRIGQKLFLKITH